MLFFYFSGSFVAMVLTVTGWLFVAFLKRSPLEHNLRKINMTLSWRNAEPTCCTRSPGALVRINFFSRILIENMIWSWVGVAFFVADRFLALLKFFSAKPDTKRARHRMWNLDLDVDEVWRLVYVLYSGAQKSETEIAQDIQEILLDESDLEWMCPDQQSESIVDSEEEEKVLSEELEEVAQKKAV